MLPSHIVFFTDLDGTLLDQHTYSWREASEALAEIERRKIPLVFCTSKTRAEVEFLRRKIGNTHPFITENGGGIFVPHGYFPRRVEGATTVKTFHCLALARPYSEILDALDEIAAQAGVEAVGFHKMSAKEIAENSGLDAEQVQLARQRDYDEPFFLAGATPKQEEHFIRLARDRKIEVVRGTRFWHIHAGSDKGRAVRELMKYYRAARRGEKLRAIAFGDSANDLPMLAAADVAVLLPKPDGSFDEAVLAKLPRVTRGSAPGPAGWNEAVLELLQAEKA
ncbi:MAG TPA: HAD-IIB family hydrolase [Candidatus Acidoferrales bacterium]|nr:HAD-IIB family hydrolase [Candidatus Acidoferrales bacterium]